MSYLQQILATTRSIIKAMNDLFEPDDQDLLTNRPENIPSTDSIAILSPEMALMLEI